MDATKLLDMLKKDPNLVLVAADTLVTAAKKDPTLVVDILEATGGQKKATDVIKAHPAVVFALMTTLLPALGIDGVTKLLAAIQ